MKHTLFRSLIALAGLVLVVLVPSAKGDSLDLIVHAIRPVGACTSPSDADSATAYSLLSGKLVSLTYKTNPSTFPGNLNVANAQAAIGAAAATWETGTGAGDLLTDGGPTSARAGKLDGVNAISWGGANGAVAVAYTWVSRSTGLVVEADLAFNKTFAWSTNGALTEDPANPADDCSGAANAFDVQAVAAHELGHWFRLGHTDNDVQTMFGFVSYQELYPRSLALGDVAGANAKY